MQSRCVLNADGFYLEIFFALGEKRFSKAASLNVVSPFWLKFYPPFPKREILNGPKYSDKYCITKRCVWFDVPVWCTQLSPPATAAGWGLCFSSTVPAWTKSSSIAYDTTSTSKDSTSSTHVSFAKNVLAPKKMLKEFRDVFIDESDRFKCVLSRRYSTPVNASHEVSIVFHEL